MTPEVATIHRLLDVTPLTALVGTRIYNQHLPQKPTLPCVLVFRATGPFGGQHLRGYGGSSWARVQVEARAASKATADAIAAAVYGDGNGEDASGLFGWIGSVGGSPGFRIFNVEDAGGRSGYDADELRQYWDQRDFIVRFLGVA